MNQYAKDSSSDAEIKGLPKNCFVPEQHTLKVFDNRISLYIFVPQRNYQESKDSHSEELQSVNSSLDIRDQNEGG